MNILFVSHLFPRPTKPVNGVFVLRQAKAISARGHNVRVISPIPYVPRTISRLLDRPTSAEVPHKATYDDITVYYPRYWSLPRSETLPLISYSVRRTLKKHKKLFRFADLINAHVAVPDGFASIPLAQELDIPLVTTIHGADLQRSVHNSLVKPQIRSTVNSSAAVILNSHKLRRIFSKHFDTDAVTEVIHNGIPLEMVTESQEHAVDSTADRIISVGNIIETKGQRYVLEAIAEMDDNIKYTIVGDGPLKEELEDYATSLGIREAVTFEGEVPHQEVFSHLKSADVFTLPSYQEAFGIVYIEAMACGLPVIACESEGPSDYITDRETGFLVPPHDSKALSDILRELHRNPELRQRVGKRGQRTAFNAFSWERNAKSVEGVFKNAVTRHGRMRNRIKRNHSV